MDVETGSIIWRENYYLKIKMDKCKLFVNLIKKSFTKRHWDHGFVIDAGIPIRWGTEENDD